MDVNIWGDAKKDRTISKNYVGLLPENPKISGFLFTYNASYDETIYNIALNDTSFWRSIASVDTTIYINLPFDVKIWSIFLNGDVYDPFYADNNNRTKNIELLCIDNSKVTSIGREFACKLITGTKLFIYIDNAPKRKHYRFIFRSDVPRVTSLRKLQLYIYID